MKMKKVITSTVAVAMALAMATPAFAYPKEMEEIPNTFFMMEDFSWKSGAHAAMPNLDSIAKPSAWAEEAVYASLTNNLGYMAEYDKATDSLVGDLKPWKSNITRDDFAESVYTTTDVALNKLTNKYFPKFAQFRGGDIKEFIDPTFDSFMNTWMVHIRDYYNFDDYMKSEATVSELRYEDYLDKGGKLDMPAYKTYISAFHETVPDEMRFYKFNDINNIWIEKLAYAGIIGGTGNGNFSPNETITRQQAAVIIVNVFEKMGIPLEKSTKLYADDSEISDYAKEAVYTVSNIKDDNGYSVMAGVGNDRFDPNGKVTYEQSAVIAVRMLYAIKVYGEDKLKDYVMYY